MNLEEVIKEMEDKPYLRNMGKGLLSKRLKCSTDTIRLAKQTLRDKTNNNITTIPKILILDIETAPLKAYVWSRWKQNISLDATISEWFMICWSAKWLNSNITISDSLTPEEAIQEDDLRITKHLWNLVNQADIVVAYNGKKADIKWINTRFIIHKLPPTSPYFVVDPCEVAKRTFGFSSNKLDALAGYFNIDHKIKTDFQLWKDCLNGQEEALNYMVEYNKLDVEILEKVYLRMRPWIVGHPNIGNITSTSRPICTFCGSELLEEEDKKYYTSIGKYTLYRCKHCGGLSRSRNNQNKKINKLTSIGK